MLTRRQIFAAPLALVAIAKGWFEKPTIGVDFADGPDEQVTCCSCPSPEYRVYESKGPDADVERLILLCDTCAEKQGYLCKYRVKRTDSGATVLWSSCETNCGKRGCPSISMPSIGELEEKGVEQYRNELLERLSPHEWMDLVKD